jgi:hypothetical protein
MPEMGDQHDTGALALIGSEDMDGQPVIIEHPDYSESTPWPLPSERHLWRAATRAELEAYWAECGHDDYDPTSLVHGPRLGPTI